MNKSDIDSHIDNFLKSIDKIKWFGNSGQENVEYTVVYSFTEAWDDWNKKMLEVWSKESHNLEAIAIEKIGDEFIDLVFERVSKAIGSKIENGFCQFQGWLGINGYDNEDYGLGNEIIDFIKRDVAWACIESILGIEGFFGKVLEVHNQGRWACAWDGSYPDGKFVVM